MVFIDSYIPAMETWKYYKDRFEQFGELPVEPALWGPNESQLQVLDWMHACGMIPKYKLGSDIHSFIQQLVDEEEAADREAEEELLAEESDRMIDEARRKAARTSSLRRFVMQKFMNPDNLMPAEVLFAGFKRHLKPKTLGKMLSIRTGRVLRQSKSLLTGPFSPTSITPSEGSSSDSSSSNSVTPSPVASRPPSLTPSGITKRARRNTLIHFEEPAKSKPNQPVRRHTLGNVHSPRNTGPIRSILIPSAPVEPLKTLRRRKADLVIRIPSSTDSETPTSPLSPTSPASFEVDSFSKSRKVLYSLVYGDSKSSMVKPKLVIIIPSYQPLPMTERWKCSVRTMPPADYLLFTPEENRENEKRESPAVIKTP
ncbi:hypothetical protein C8J56DRAFT_1171226, partial [Mycena floridula]